jgi:hypothetical protein
VVGRLDPETGKVVEYPFPHAENSLRDFFMDDKGRMWFGSPATTRSGISIWLGSEASCAGTGGTCSHRASALSSPGLTGRCSNPRAAGSSGASTKVGGYWIARSSRAMTAV